MTPEQIAQIEARHAAAEIEMEEWAETHRGMAAHKDRGALLDDNKRLREALKLLDALYAHWWDSADQSGAIMLLPSSVPQLEEAHERARAALNPKVSE